MCLNKSRSMSIEALSFSRAERPSVPSSYTTWMVALCCLSLISTSLEAYVSGIRYTSYAVLPAFSKFTGVKVMHKSKGDTIFAIVNQSVIAV